MLGPHLGPITLRTFTASVILTVPVRARTTSARKRAMSSPTPDLADLGLRATQLRPPLVAARSIGRPRLQHELDRQVALPFSLVCAPPGYGKSVLLTQWCESLDQPVAWLSLDEDSNEPRVFLSYVVAAVRRVAPDALSVTGELAGRLELPEESVLITYLLNEFEALDERIVLVLDDYHTITSEPVHRIVAELMDHPPWSVHLVIASRFDPPLPIATIRAKGQLAELRMADLRFTRVEANDCLERELESVADPDTAEAIYEQAEGWPAGIRMASEALRSGAAAETPVAAAGLLDRRTQEYLVQQVLDRQPEPVRRYLMTASLFDRFGAELCEAALTNGDAEGDPMTGREFIDWLVDKNLFVVALDEHGHWYRFHHLFADLLRTWRDETTTGDFSKAHRAASRWFASQGAAEQAIVQSLLAGDIGAAVRLAAERGIELVNGELWPDLGRLLDQIPDDVLDADPRLLVLRGWLAGEGRARHEEMREVLEKAQSILDDPSVDVGAETKAQLRGDIAVLWASYIDFAAGHLERALEGARRAADLLGAVPTRSLSHALVLQMVVLAHAGRVQEAYALAEKTMGDPRLAATRWAPAAWGMPYVGWAQADMHLIDRYAPTLITDGERWGLPDSLAAGHYFLGTSAYMQDRLDDAISHLSEVLEHRFVEAAAIVIHAAVAVAHTQLAQGNLEEARGSAELMMRYLLESRSETLMPVAEAFQADLDLQQGNRIAALRWARRARVDEHAVAYMFYEALTTVPKILLLVGTGDDRKRAGDLIARLLPKVHGVHYPMTIQLLGLDALRRSAEDDPDGALDSLREAVHLSRAGGAVRLLADLGPDLGPLLHRLDVTGEELGHVRAVLGAMDTPATSPAATPAAAPVAVKGQPALTEREVQVLGLLADRRSNKEIGQELLIAAATVKKHTLRLYTKLNVHSRREAVAKAQALGYLDGDTATP